MSQVAEQPTYANENNVLNIYSVPGSSGSTTGGTTTSTAATSERVTDAWAAMAITWLQYLNTSVNTGSTTGWSAPFFEALTSNSCSLHYRRWLDTKTRDDSSPIHRRFCWQMDRTGYRQIFVDQIDRF